MPCADIWVRTEALFPKSPEVTSFLTLGPKIQNPGGFIGHRQKSSLTVHALNHVIPDKERDFEEGVGSLLQRPGNFQV